MGLGAHRTAFVGVRLFIDRGGAEGEMRAGERVVLPPEQAHYLGGVMRMRPGDALAVFDGRSGEHAASVVAVSRRAAELELGARTAPLRRPPDVWLLFAPIKKARTDFIVEKAAELGAARILPVRTERTQSERVRVDRLRAHAVEAAEQCGGTFVPEVAEMTALEALMDGWDPARRLVFCDEGAAGGPAGMPDAPAPAAILVGPEGGFAEAERSRLRRVAAAASLGPRILRADTAAVAALSLWQAAHGDWR
jgi:16S rRNA (uracil1498-N3)-methyltransferase